MNLVNGVYLDTAACEPVLDELENRIVSTLERGGLNPERVIAACDRLVRGLDEGDYLPRLAEFGVPAALARRYLDEAREAFCAEALRERLQRELGGLAPGGARCYAPLGTLLHIAAGNMDGLPAFSVLEGLLTGNVNILKLPSEENGVSAALLSELIRAEPALSPYIYVFDYSSKDLVNMEKLIAVSDAVVVWGGDAAVSALRGLVRPDTRLIEWGHKVSFGYLTPAGITDEGLRGFAQNIAETSQALCSSCQGLYLDTDDMAEVKALAERFLPILEAEAAKSARAADPNTAAQITLELYTARLEAPLSGDTVYWGKNCGVLARVDRAAEPSPAPCAPWVKALPRKKLLRTLHPYKNHLQTVGLLCAPEERERLTNLLFKTGVVRVTDGAGMSRTPPDAPHDGEYPLRRYVKIVESV